MTARRIDSPRALDAFDMAILRIVQKDAKTPQRLIAEAVNLSPAAIQRRITAMEASGVIARNVALLDAEALGLDITAIVALLDAEALGLDITAIVEITLRDERAATVDAAKARFKTTPEVQQCYYVTGGVSFVLVVVSRDMRTYEALTRSLFAENDLVARYRTLVALDTAKAETALPI